MTWMDYAACASHDLPPSAWTEQPTDGHWGKDRNGRAAVRVCRVCPVAAECLRDALAIEGRASALFRWGIIAGTTPAQRATIANTRVAAAK